VGNKTSLFQRSQSLFTSGELMFYWTAPNCAGGAFYHNIFYALKKWRYIFIRCNGRRALL